MLSGWLLSFTQIYRVICLSSIHKLPLFLQYSFTHANNQSSLCEGLLMRRIIHTSLSPHLPLGTTQLKSTLLNSTILAFSFLLNSTPLAIVLVHLILLNQWCDVMPLEPILFPHFTCAITFIIKIVFSLHNWSIYCVKCNLLFPRPHSFLRFTLMKTRIKLTCLLSSPTHFAPATVFFSLSLVFCLFFTLFFSLFLPAVSCECKKSSFFSTLVAFFCKHRPLSFLLL